MEYIGRGDGTEQTLGKKTFRALAGETVNVETEEFANYEREPGQDMTLLVTADGKAVKRSITPGFFMTGLFFRHREVIFRLFTGTGATTSVRK